MAQNELTQNIGDAQKSLKVLSEDSAKALQETEKMVNALSASFQAVQNVSKAAGKEVTELSKSQQLVNTALSAFQVMVSAATVQVQLATAAQQLWNMALNANLIGVVITSISALVGALTFLSGQQDEQSKKMEEITAKAQKQRQAWDDLKASQEAQIRQNSVEIDHIAMLWQEMQTLVDESGKVIGNKERLKFIIDEINSVIPDAISWLGEERIAYQDNADAIENMLKQKQALARLEAQEPMYQEALVQKDEIKNELQELDTAVAEQEAKIDELKAKRDELDAKGYSTLEVDAKLAGARDDLNELNSLKQDFLDQYFEATQTVIQYENDMQAVISGNAEEIGRIILGLHASRKGSSEEYKEYLHESIKDLDSEISLAKSLVASGIATADEVFLPQLEQQRSILQKEGERIGESFAAGIEQGIAQKGGLIFKRVQDIGKGMGKTGKETIESHSPSKVAAREIGVPFIQGILVGMEQEAPHLFQATVAISKEALERAKAEAGSYREIGSLYLDYLKEGVDANTSQAITTFTNLLNESVEALIAKNPDAKSALQQEGREAINAYTKAIQAGGKESVAAVKELMDEVSQTAQNKYDEISRKQQNLSNKLAGYGSLFQVKDQEVAIADVQQYTNTISQYMDLLQQLKASGAGEAVLAEVSRLGIDEGMLVAQELLTMAEENPADFAALVADWEENRRKTEELAESFYAAEMQQLEASFQEDLSNVLAKVPSLVEGSGRAAMEGFIKGWQSKDEDLTQVIEQTIDRAIRAMQEGWEEHSPSKVTERIGANVGLGFIQGYDKTMSALAQQMSQAVAQESSAFQQQALAVAANQGGLWARNTTTREIHNHTVQEKVVGVRFSGDLAAVARLLKPELDAEASRYGAKLAQG